MRWYAAFSFALVAGYLAFPAELRTIPFLIVTFAAIPAVIGGMRRSPAAARAPWWPVLAGLVVFNLGNLAWLWYFYVQGRATGDGTLADLLYNLANLLMLAGAMSVVLRRGRRDIGGLIDSGITAFALGGLLWDSFVLPQLTAADTPMSRQAALFVNVLVMAGSLGALLRVSTVSGRQVPALWLMTISMGTGLAGNLAAAFAIDPATGTRPDWTTMIFMAGYTFLGCAALHPSAADATRTGPEPKDDLTAGRLTFLGIMTALIPIVGGGRAVFKLPTDGLLVALGSAVVIPLVMVRVARLANQRRRAERALLRMVNRDPLTGLPNRAGCLERLAAELERPGVAVLFCDLDGFKPVNDRLGHAAGDELLIAVAARLRGCVREQDLVSRFGGDEFVVVLRDAHPRVAVAAACARISEMVSRPLTAGGESVRIGMSVGVAFADRDASVDDLLNRADLAMYQAKQSKNVGALSLSGL
ncbi:diguanylate cyclase domain-containing protein [Actinoplanes sp. NPDC049668]|uniref:GGDEF domain-containing protein n=1 Tax=unclassified Actinoplanes TaxID=2626549 RepID=UPI0033B45351